MWNVHEGPYFNRDGSVLYAQPQVLCVNMRRHTSFDAWPIVLPYPTLPGLTQYLPKTEATDSGPEAIACPACGLVTMYRPESVGWLAESRPAEGSYASAGRMVRVETECAQKDCRLPVVFHTPVDVDGQKDETAVMRSIRASFYTFACSRGHEMMPVPEDRHRMTRVARLLCP